MGPSISKYNCTKINGTEQRIIPEPDKRKKRRRSSLRDVIQDLQSFLRSSDPFTRSTYFVYMITSCDSDRLDAY